MKASPRRPRLWPIVFAGVLTCSLLAVATMAAAAPLVVGSKRFTESYILGEVVKQTLEQAGIDATHKQGLGNTGILEQALASGAVDVYPEYTGTIVRELLKREPDPAHPNPSVAQLNEWLAPRGLKVAVPLGFNDTYALAMLDSTAQRLEIARVSDLSKPEAAKLRLGLSHEFLVRGDGWPALKRAYQLPFTPPPGLDHGLAYDAVSNGQVDVIDVYSTDAQLARRPLRVLQDDRGFFPAYDAVLLMRASVDTAPLAKLEGHIDARAMIKMNAEAEIDHVAFAEVARRFLAGEGERPTTTSSRQVRFINQLFGGDFVRLSMQHLTLVFGSLALAVVAGIPLGIAAWRWPRCAGFVLGTVGVLQTLPSLAVLAFLIAIVGGIGPLPAVIALFLYALLPIVRNTHTGLIGVAPGLLQAALSLGLRPPQCLRFVQLPIAAPTIWSGVKTAAVINVGTATIAAFVGAGGYGERIVSGLAVNDTSAMLAGALPAALLALIVQALFGWLERRWVPHVEAA